MFFKHWWKHKPLLFEESELCKGCPVKPSKQPNQFKLWCLTRMCLYCQALFLLLSVVPCHHLLHSLCPSSLISHMRLRKTGGSCWSASRNCQSISHSGLPPKKQNKLFSQPASSLPSGLRSKTVWTLPYGSQHVIVSFHQEATQRAFSQFDLYFPFISNMLPGTQSLSLSCFVFPESLVSLFSYVPWSIHLQDWRARNTPKISVCSTFDIISSILF